MTNDRINVCVAVVVFALCVAGSGALVGPINRDRQRLGVISIQTFDRTMPPAVTLATTALGSFRGLAVDVLWFRANRLKEEGQFFEANQLSQWITSLQPRFPQVWSFHAWNMAYNISVATHTPEERWEWVSKGIALLRDKGIVYNPTAIRLYRELGWIFFHKIGHYMDDMHWYYKLRLASSWQELLGAPSRGATTEQMVDEFRRIANAPVSIELLIDQHGGVEELLVAFKKLGYGPDETLLRQIGKIDMYKGWSELRLMGDYRFDPRKAFDPGLAQLLAQPAHASAVEPLVAFLRRDVLRRNYHMDPAFMLKLMELYGPMDWRHPASHGCYWSEMGVKMAVRQDQAKHRGKLSSLTEIDLLNTNRQSIQSLQQLAWNGRVAFDPIAGRIDFMPDTRFIPAYDHAMDMAKQRIESGAFGGMNADSFAMGHENFLLKAMTDHYLYGDMQQAQYFYKKVRDLYGNRPQNRDTGRYRKPLGELVTDQLIHHLELMTNTRQFIRAMLGRAFDHGLGENDMKVFDRYVQIASVAHSRYQADKDRDPTASRGRMRLLPFDQVLAETYLAYMQSPDLSLLTRSRAWGNTPLELRRRVYTRLRPVIAQQAEAAGLVTDLAFPAPLGGAPSDDTQRSPRQATDVEAPVRIERQ